ncbi:type I-F CRISPR-associated endoribonuclease Cas6/Csy4 [Thauera sp. Sel9]|uniref:type I-F CRISPR-associated endoribonuclease Cas6/Csy4 n=1 Tax=Thauera sp. Sel9 TaxID=2974299 RepID=UPI0021E1459D|nr:type I-F CRISPR-associated endoribonuclease Cas6/Csy4 [Thauera sp. Sel9]MCV2217040.1 type I-F CRISPR-associated endoribonuclease Cas6/Csy4 [Thauera sp. Sel9]
MDHYLDLTLLPDPEFPASQLMSALFAKLHRGLHDLHRNDVGISFPDVEKAGSGLGSRLRLHGNAEVLNQLMALNWLTGMRDHLNIGATVPTPQQTKHRCVSRVQVDSNPERLRRRLMKRHNLDAAAAQARIPDSAAQRSDLPFVNLRSNSSGEHFRLFIRHSPLQDSAQPGAFSAYGLSATTTVPWF